MSKEMKVLHYPNGLGNPPTEITTNKITIVVNDVEYDIKLDRFDDSIEIIKSSFGEEKSSISIIPKVSNHINIK